MKQNGAENTMFEVTGSPEKIDELIALLQEFSIIELAGSGLVSTERDNKQKELSHLE